MSAWQGTLRVLGLLVLFAGTQITRFENELYIRYDGEVLTAESDRAVARVEIGAERFTSVRGAFQQSMAGTSGLAGFALDDGDSGIVSEASRRVVYLFGVDVLGTLAGGESPVGPRTFGDWTQDRALRAPATIVATPLPERFVLALRLVGRGQKTIELAGTRRVRVNLHDGLIDNALGLCVDDSCGKAVTAAEPVATNLLRLANAALEALLGGGLLVTILPGLLSASGPAGPPARRRVLAALGAACVAHFVLAVSMASILGFIPHLPDSAVYTRQAILLARGMLEIPSFDFAPAEAFLPAGASLRDGALVFHYSHFWPAILALGIVAGVPWLVNPVLSVLNVALLYALGARLVGYRAALVAAVLWALSPLAVILAADRMSHTATLTCLLASSCLALRAVERGGYAAPLGAGALGAWAFAMRPLTALAFLAPIAVYAAMRSSTWRALVCNAVRAVAGALPVVVLVLLDNHLITGNALVSPYAAFHAIRISPANLVQGLDYVDATLGYLPPIVSALPWPQLFVCLPIAAVLRPGSNGARLSLAVFATVAAAYSLVAVHGLHGYGPRFLAEAAAVLMLPAGATLVAAWDVAERPTRHAVLGAAAVAGVVFAAYAFATTLPLYRRYNGIDPDLFADLRAIDLEHAIVVAADPSWQGLEIAATLFDPTYTESMFIRELSDGSHLRVLEDHPERSVYRVSDGAVQRVR